MLGFRDYRNRFTEAPAGEPVANPADVVKSAKTDQIGAEIDKLVDGWIADLKRTLMNPITGDGQQRGLWDRFKNTMSNLWHGRYKQSNPYFWQNKLGDDLGATEAFQPNPLSLSEYKSLREVVDSIEEIISEAVPTGTENLRINRLIDMKAQELKEKLRGIIMNQPHTDTPTSPTFPPPADSVPAKSGGLPPVDAPKTDEEEDSEPSSRDAYSLELLRITARSLLSRKEIDEPMFKKIMAGLSSKKESQRMAAADELQKLGSKGPTKPADPADPPTDPRHAMRPDQPPTTGKKWNELNDAERHAWNIYGGGLEDTPGKIDGCLNDHGIKRLPWVLRIGDPRRQILEDQFGGKLPLSDRCSKRAGSFWHTKMEALGRKEDMDHPIKSWAELENAVVKAKAATAEFRTKLKKGGRTTAPSDEDIARDDLAAKSIEKPLNKPADPRGPDTVPVEPTATPTGLPDLKDRKARKARKALIDPDEVKEKIIHTPDNALGKPAHRTTSIDAPEPPEGATPAPKKSVREVTPLFVQQYQADLKERIGKISDKETRQQLARSLKIAKTEEALAEIEKELKIHERLHLDVSWTINDTKNHYMRRLQERKEPPKKADPNIISFDERVNYYRELISQR